MKVCVAEKPSVAREIANILGANTNKGGYLEGNGYQVTWVFGHLCELKEPHDYSPIWKSWNKYDLPIIPDKFGIKLKNDSGVARQFDIIKNLISSADEVINCGDAGQEGELIQRWVYQLAGIKCPVKRLWISSLTEEAINEGFNSLRDGSDFDNLYAAGASRAMSDWLLGMNATRAYTLRFARDRQVLSIGRVQTPTLALIVNRHREIENFKPQTYWEIKTNYRNVVFTASSGKFDSKEDADKVLSSIVDKNFVVTDIQTKNGIESSPRLFDLTSLQVECNKKYAFSAEDTLRHIQSLYEKKLTTYPRVDTTFLPDDVYPKIPSILAGLAPYQNLVAPLLSENIKKNKRVFDSSKVTDHHAIIPTGVPPMSNLSRDEKLVYDLVARRFIANFYPDCKVSTTSVLGEVVSLDNVKVGFKCSGKQILYPGWRVVFGKNLNDDDAGADQEQIMPEFVLGESGLHIPSVSEKQTQPPKPYTEASLLRAMETAGKQVDDEELRDLMKDNGIGRPSTRAAIIETLFKRRYIIKQKKNLIPTATGIQLIDLIKIDLLKSVELTGQWEKKLRLIERGDFKSSVFIDEMKALVTQVVRMVDSDMSIVRLGQSDEVTPQSKSEAKKTPAKRTVVLECPLCHNNIVKGKTSWGCLGYREGCKFRLPFEFMGKKLSDTHVKTLLTKGETAIVKGIDYNGAKVDAKFMFDGDFNLIMRQMDEKPIDVESLSCPVCGKYMMTGRSGWGCSGYKEGCRFVVPFEFMHKKLTVTHLSVLCLKRQTGSLSGFVNEMGAKVAGKLVVDESGGLSLVTK